MEYVPFIIGLSIVGLVLICGLFTPFLKMLYRTRAVKKYKSEVKKYNTSYILLGKFKQTVKCGAKSNHSESETLVYMIANENSITVYFLDNGHNELTIMYNDIVFFDAVYHKTKLYWNITDRWPKSLDVFADFYDTISICYIDRNDSSKKTIYINLCSDKKTGVFNNYSLSKANFFNYIAQILK